MAWGFREDSAVPSPQGTYSLAQELAVKRADMQSMSGLRQHCGGSCAQVKEDFMEEVILRLSVEDQGARRGGREVPTRGVMTLCVCLR